MRRQIVQGGRRYGLNLRSSEEFENCHIYSDAHDVVYADQNFLCIYAPDGGVRTVFLPKKRRVVDLLENRVVSEGTDQFRLAMASNQSSLMSLQPG